MLLTSNFKTGVCNRMKRHFILLSALLAAGCGSAEQRRHAKLMDAVEQSLKLPNGAEQLPLYARAYKFASPSRVVASYFIPDGSFDGGFCAEAKSGGRTNGQIALLCPPPDGMKAGERRWFADDVYLPDILDGGCSYIAIEYDVHRKAIISANCNGEA